MTSGGAGVRVLVTGGAGFVGANLAVALAARPGFDVVAFDNLNRRGSELNLPRLRERLSQDILATKAKLRAADEELRVL